jgi:hypothetical protein
MSTDIINSINSISMKNEKKEMMNDSAAARGDETE